MDGRDVRRKNTDIISQMDHPMPHTQDFMLRPSIFIRSGVAYAAVNMHAGGAGSQTTLGLRMRMEAASPRRQRRRSILSTLSMGRNSKAVDDSKKFRISKVRASPKRDCPSRQSKSVTSLTKTPIEHTALASHMFESLPSSFSRLSFQYLLYVFYSIHSFNIASNNQWKSPTMHPPAPYALKNMSTPENAMINCGTCSRPLRYKIVKSNTNGNCGRYYARCFNPHTVSGIPCKFWDWYDSGPLSQPPSRSPTQSPATSATINQPTSSANEDARFPPPSQPSIPPREVCRTLGCKSGRLRKGCSRRMCKAHCQEQGPGCSDVAHKASQPWPSTQNAAASVPWLLPNSTPAATPFASNQAAPTSFIPSQVSVHASNISVAQPVDSTPRSHLQVPAYSSHMAPVFTEQIRVQQELAEQRRREEAVQKTSDHRAKQTILVYVWTEDDTEPEIVLIQDGFTLPHFQFTADVLQRTLGSVDVQFQVFNMDYGVWATAIVNHIVTVTAKGRVFIKASHVRSCKDLVVHTGLPSVTSPNIRTNLAGERAYIKKRIAEQEFTYLQQHTTPRPTKRPYSYLSDSPSSPLALAKSRKIAMTRIKKAAVTGTSPAPDPEDVIEISDSDDFAPIIPYRRPHQVKEEPQPPALPLALTMPSMSTIIPSHLAADKKAWPADFYAADVVACFKNADEHSWISMKSVFETHFPSCRFTRSTYYEHRARWKAASLATQNAFVGAGRTPAGLWSSFMAVTRAPKAELSAIRRRKQVDDDGEL
ncbi:hypothetical protein BJ912DRAFT_469098 [Pholiota molesta]|nr:hypothetical protein BJ912DRAFT_469098 [Pholiota molesta]